MASVQSLSRATSRRESKTGKVFESPFAEVQGPSNPQVWIKLRPSTDYQNSALEPNPDGKTLELLLPEESSSLPKSVRPSFRSYESDGILQNASHEETFRQMAEDVIVKAMNGISGVILSLGPEGCGKSFTFYGDFGKYENRGLIPRSFEKIFEYAEARRDKIKYSIRAGMVEVRKDKIRDLISLSPYELKTIGDNGPNGMMMHSLECAEHALALLIRAVAAQKLMSRQDPFAKFHTILYVEIEAESIPTEDQKLMFFNPIKFTSRITFAKVASIPTRLKDAPPVTANTNERLIQSQDCFYITPATAPPRPSTRADLTTAVDNGSRAGKKDKLTCCSMKSGPVAEEIAVRRDLLFLEQMFIRVNELQKLQRYYRKLAFVGMQAIMRKPNLAPSQYFRQNKLCHCLRELVCCSNEIRVLLHLRPESQYLSTVLEALRFADRIRSIPRDVNPNEYNFTGDKLTDLNSLRREIRVLRAELENVSRSTRELADDTVELSPSQYRLLQDQAAGYANGTIDQLEVGTKAEAKALFQSFRTLFQTATAEIPVDRKSTRKMLKSKNPSYAGTVSEGKEERESGKKLKAKKSSRRKKGKKGTKSSPDPSEIGIPEEEVAEEEEVQAKAPSKFPLEGLEGIVQKMGFSSKAEALETFRQTELGSRMVQDLEARETALQDATNQHAEALQNANDFFKQVFNKQAEFDAIQQERHSKGDEYDTSGNIIVPKKEKDLLIELRVMKDSRDQLLDQLKKFKTELQTQKSAFNDLKLDYETQFQIFCLERYTGQLEEEAGEFAQETEAPIQSEGETDFERFCQPQPYTEDQSMKFEDLKRMASDQAKEILKYYRSRPQWRNY